LRNGFNARFKMKIIWNRIEKWLDANAPEVLSGFNLPATQIQITQAEAALGISFPQDIVDTFMIHNGQISTSPWVA
jgi:cell wall assembly regulator SMI1